MKFTLEIPDPATMRVGKEVYISLPAGTALDRIHQKIFNAHQFNGTDKGDARFSPIRDAAGAVIPTIYAAEGFECAACEIILRCPDAPAVDPASGLPTFRIVYPSDFKDHSHSVVRTALDLKLVDLTIAGQRKIGVDGNALLAGPKSTYPATRGWAAQIHAKCPDAQGLYYSSFQFGPQFAVVLFGDRLGPGALVAETSRSVADPACHDEIGSLARSLSIEYGDV